MQFALKEAKLLFELENSRHAKDAAARFNRRRANDRCRIVRAANINQNKLLTAKDEYHENSLALIQKQDR
jgi:hypothetical protein